MKKISKNVNKVETNTNLELETNFAIQYFVLTSD